MGGKGEFWRCVPLAARPWLPARCPSGREVHVNEVVEWNQGILKFEEVEGADDDEHVVVADG